MKQDEILRAERYWQIFFKVQVHRFLSDMGIFLMLIFWKFPTLRQFKPLSKKWRISGQQQQEMSRSFPERVKTNIIIECKLGEARL